MSFGEPSECSGDMQAVEDTLERAREVGSSGVVPEGRVAFGDVLYPG